METLKNRQGNQTKLQMIKLGSLANDNKTINFFFFGLQKYLGNSVCAQFWVFEHSSSIK